MSAWQLQEAKARLSELVKVVEQEGPQEITVHGRPVAVILSRRDYERLSGTSESLVAFMRRSPLHGADDLEFVRDQSPTRNVEL